MPCSQLQTGKGGGADSYNGMVDCFQKIVKNEGQANTTQPVPGTRLAAD